jgi:uncharacterized SAM-binding protein YcdF (DUF218 family)
LPVNQRSRTQPRKSVRRRPQRRVRSRLIVRLCAGCAVLFVVLLIWAAAARTLAPRSNTKRQTLDAILILGTPADSDGNPTPEMLDRVTEGVHEYERGIAPRILVTGAAAHNQFVEADVMAHVAQAQGVPASVLFEEPHALDTIQNACFSNRILSSHGWHSVEVVSSASHLPRAAMIFAHLAANQPGSLEWRMHAAPANLNSGYYSTAATAVEILKTARYLVWARWMESCAA